MNFCTVTLTGTKQSQIKQVADQIQVGTVLSIHRRPDNAYDTQAMSVHFGLGITSPMVGWIPAKEIEDKTRKEVLFNIVPCLQANYLIMVAKVVQYEAESKFLRCEVLVQDNPD